MNAAELMFIQIARRYTLVGIQVAKVYSQEQAKLQLDQVLTQERLSSSRGTRERWIDAAEEICFLIESRRQTCVFSEAGVDFSDDKDLESFGELLAVVDEIHQLEVVRMQERLERIARAAALLGVEIPL